MKEFAPQLAQVSSAERLITTLFFAVLLHGIVILGVRFTGEEASSQTGSTLEVTLVNTARNELPDDADYLANASQKGAGNTEERARPQSAMSSPDEFALDGAPEAADLENRLEPRDGSEKPDAMKTPDKLTEADKQVLTRADSSLKAPSEASAPQADSQRLLVARLMTPGLDMIEPVNDSSQRPLAHSENIREKFIAVNTRESVYARYLDEWRRRVEKVGNGSYPAELKARGLSGSLVMEVSLNADGTLRDLDIRRRSQYPEMDAAALKILRMASPFPPFSEAMRDETDVLKFMYEWRFGKEGASGTISARR